jgi:hypothetical protein
MTKSATSQGVGRDPFSTQLIEFIANSTSTPEKFRGTRSGQSGSMSSLAREQSVASATGARFCGSMSYRRARGPHGSARKRRLNPCLGHYVGDHRRDGTAKSDGRPARRPLGGSGRLLRSECPLTRLWPDVSALRGAMREMMDVTDIALRSFDDEAQLWGDATPAWTVSRMAGFASRKSWSRTALAM